MSLIKTIFSFHSVGYQTRREKVTKVTNVTSEGTTILTSRNLDTSHTAQLLGIQETWWEATLLHDNMLQACSETDRCVSDQEYKKSLILSNLRLKYVKSMSEAIPVIAVFFSCSNIIVSQRHFSIHRFLICRRER